VTDVHLARRLEKALGDDERTNELGVRIRVTDVERILVEGEVASEERRHAVLDVIREHEPELLITDHLTVSAEAVVPPPGREAIATPKPDEAR
jgi:hypothetical protein